MNTCVFAFETCVYILWQCIRYGLGNARMECIKNTANFLSKRNILYSKIFQTLATSASVLTVDEIMFLSQFNDNAPYTEEDIYPIQELMNTLNVHSKSINNHEIILHSYIPENAGIIALVYYGTLEDKEVVIKVKRRNIETKLKDGIDNCETFVRYFKYVPYLNRLQLEVIFQENKADLFRQLDFNNEVNVMECFRHKYRNTSYVSIPKAYLEYTLFNPNVIIMEKVSGHRLNDTSFRSDTELKSKFGYLLAKYSIRSLLFDRVYHADLHAGNIFFNEDDPNDLKICIIDFGITGAISKEYQNYFYLFFTNVVMEDKYMAAAKICIDHFTTPKYGFVKMGMEDMDRLTIELCSVIKLIFDTNCQFDTKIIYIINNSLYKYGLTLDPNFCRIQMSLAVCSSVCNELCNSDTKYIDYLKLATKEIMDSFNETE